MRSRAPLGVAFALAALAACGGGDAPAPDGEVADTAIEIIEPPDSGPSCIDGTVVPPDVGPCTSDAECAARLGPAPACQVAVCLTAGECAFTAIADGALCDDGDRCTLGDACASGACRPGATALACDDDDPCTDDGCDPALGCVSSDNTAPCDDGNPCTEGDRCAGGVCVGGPSICECEDDVDCPQDEDLCNGALVCDGGHCATDPATVVSCAPSADPCLEARCEPETGACVDRPRPDGTACDDGDPCTGGDQCVAGMCKAGAINLCGCPADMVEVEGRFCIDRYEASRPDATAASFGVDGARATSRGGVLPWFPVERAGALAACQAAGKRLCTADELAGACGGPGETTYPYGDTYDPLTCNGIDTYCRCDAPACATIEPCPYPRCYNQTPSGQPGGCGAALTVMPTGSFPACVNAYGAYDLSGNVWELVDTGTSASWYKGGAYNCIDSPALHRCDGLYQNIAAKGFRCCAEVRTP